MSTKSKRSVPSSILRMRENKRRKLLYPSSTSASSSLSASQSTSLSAPQSAPLSHLQDDDIFPQDRKSHDKKSVRLDKLKWKSVQMPDKLDDYEGFFGLEEIEDVGVVREDGVLRFEVLGDVATGQKRRKDTGEEKVVEGLHVEDLSQEVDHELDQQEEQWEGFESDDVVEMKRIKVQKSREEKDKKKSKDKDRKEKIKEKAKEKSKEKAKEKSKEKDKSTSTSTSTTTINPFTVLDDTSDSMSTTVDIAQWRPLNLSPSLHASLSHLGFSTPTSIQTAAIPKIQAGLDVIGKAPTGSGKTLAFGLPIIQAWLEDRASKSRDHVPSLNDSAEIENQDLDNPRLIDPVRPTALIIEPTRELATQVAEHLRAICKPPNLSPDSYDEDLEKLFICTLTGGLSIQKQRRLLQQADIIVATPGRLWEVASEGHGVLESLRALKFLVVDEADRLLAQGRFSDLENLIDALGKEETHDKWSNQEFVKTENEHNSENENDNENESRIGGKPWSEQTKGKVSATSENKSTISGPSVYRSPARQTLVFSATFSNALQQKLSHRSYSSTSTLSSSENMAYLLKRLPFQKSAKPTFIDTSPTNSMAAKLKEGLLECPGPEKDLYLYSLLLLQPPGTRALVFVNSIAAVQRLVPFLENLNITAYPLHSHMAQPARLRSVERFSGTSSSKSITKQMAPNPAIKGTNITVLLSTDLAARGLDIPSITLIVHYHVPRAYDVYIHRSGRTARANASGTSILMCAATEAKGVRRLVARVHAGASKRNGKSNKRPSNTSEVEVDVDASSDSEDSVSASKKKEESGSGLLSISLPPLLASRLKPRVSLAKQLADVILSKTKLSAEETWLRTAADELGVSLSDAEIETDLRSNKGRGARRKQREKEAASLSKDETRAMRAQLRELLSRRINIGVSERYIAGGAGGVDVSRLLSEEHGVGQFLGDVGALGI